MAVHPDTAKWLVGLGLTIGTMFVALVWWSAQIDAQVKSNTSDIVIIDARMTAIITRLEDINNRLIRAEVREEIMRTQIDNRFGGIERRLDNAAKASK